MKSIFEKMGGTYSLGADGLYYPDLTVPETDEAHYGKYGMLRKQYLKNHHKAIYFTLLTSCKMISHLNEIDDEANEMLELLVKQMKERQSITEELKASDQLEWVRRMNNIRNAADEIVRNRTTTTPLSKLKNS